MGDLRPLQACMHQMNTWTEGEQLQRQLYQHRNDLFPSFFRRPILSPIQNTLEVYHSSGYFLAALAIPLHPRDTATHSGREIKYH